MRLTSPSIQRLLTAAERTLVASASAASLKTLTPARLRSKITRTRGLKDKYVGLARTRGRAARGKAPAARGGSRTDAETMARKAEVFGVVLDRFTAQLRKVEAAAARKVDPATRKARARKVVAKVKRRVAMQEGHPAPEAAADEVPLDDAVAATNTARRAVSRASKAERVAQTLDASHAARAHGHISSRTQRRQARRDSAE